MNNPWLDLADTAPYVLESDKDFISKFNSKVLDYKYKIQVNVPPEPFSGNINANVILLNLNPGYTEDDKKIMVDNSNFYLSMKNNYSHCQQDYPFYHLNPNYPNNPGYKYWHSRLRHLIEKYGLDIVSGKISIIQFFPYKSIAYKDLGTILECQRYSFNLVRKAIARNALIIFIRSKKKWENAIPELRRADTLECHSPRGGFVSPGNLGSGWDRLCSTIESQLQAS